MSCYSYLLSFNDDIIVKYKQARGGNVSVTKIIMIYIVIEKYSNVIVEHAMMAQEKNINDFQPTFS